MTRALSADERALWRRVTADLRPSDLHPADVRAMTKSAATAPPADGPAKRTPVALKTPGTSVAATSSSRAPAGTLDGRWDHHLRTGQVEPDRVIDLHGCSADTAYARAIAAITAAARAGDRVVVLITGKPPPAGTSRLDTPLRGIIRASIGDWLAGSPVADRIAAIRVAHRRHGGAGAIYVILRRPGRLD